MNRCLLVCAFLLLSACNPQPSLTRFAPLEADQFARRYVQALRTGDTATTSRALTPRLLQVPGARDSLAALRHHFAPGTPDSAELVGAQVQYTGGGTWRALGYQLHSPGGWTQVQLVLQEDENGLRYVDGVHVERAPASLQQINALTLKGKGPLHFVLPLLALGVLVFSLGTATQVARTPMPWRWWWAFVALLGAGTLVLNWTTGEVFMKGLNIQLFGVGLTRQGLAGPWVLSVAFPAGALVALERRRRFLARMSSHAAPRSVGGAVLEAPHEAATGERELA